MLADVSVSSDSQPVQATGSPVLAGDQPLNASIALSPGVTSTVGKLDSSGGRTEGHLVSQTRFKFRGIEASGDSKIGTLSLALPSGARSLRRTSSGFIRRGQPNRAIVDVIVSDLGGGLEQGQQGFATRSSFAVSL